jgi:hypothetical protein
MANWKIIGSIGGGQNIDETSTYQNFPLGTIVTAKDIDGSTDYGVGEFVYAKGVASTAVGSAALIDANGFTTSLATADDTGMIGCSMSANVANQYGWYQVSGLGVVKGLASLADNKACFLTSTAGSVDDAEVAGDLIYGMTTASALDTPSSGLALVNLVRPHVADFKYA